MTHSPSFNAGNGLDNASGIATKNTSAPHNTPRHQNGGARNPVSRHRGERCPHV